MQNLTIAQTLPMSSREIAELTGKRHDHVLRDCRKMLEALNIQSPQIWGDYQDSSGRIYQEALLDQDLTMTLVMGYSIEIRHKVAKRWRELEKQLAIPADPIQMLNDPAAMRGILLTYTEKVIALENKVEEIAPDVKALHRIAKSDGGMCITNAAKELQVRPKDLFAFLRERGWIYRRVGAKNWMAYQSKIQSGHLEHKISIVPCDDGTDKIREQVLVTPKGLAKLSQTFCLEPA
ncbi:putative DNA-binding protein (Roi) [Candidatus Sodalis pierantonius str. SOPE]|uniref:Putative DNA-binding protein (Roi) n=1 Tax=Candidatus Sodalis pierantonii str. SOPE TaxID=2342 RepID=W0HJZ8_9GAMM|nr:phage regulatory protein/antirepressor Ant [Candidatus Sodalis pierantonius]AHF74191.1 putative DNA-binding protein (Roi) [Candidatus Sodalis pierantonius str. SOPE]